MTMYRGNPAARTDLAQDISSAEVGEPCPEGCMALIPILQMRMLRVCETE